jgi:hypothetical protein
MKFVNANHLQNKFLNSLVNIHALKPVSEDVTPDFAQKDALGRVSRKPKLTAHQVEMARSAGERQAAARRGVAKAFGVGRSTLYRVLKLMDDSVMVTSEAE